MQTALRNNVVKARVSPDEKRTLLAAALCRGLTLSQLIREAVERTAENVYRPDRSRGQDHAGAYQ